jgi:RNA polymerase sigma-70 factor (ECF subfamily)
VSGQVLAERDSSLHERSGAASRGAEAPTFADVWNAYGGYVLGLLRRLGVAAGEVEDVAQEVFLTVHAKLPAFEGRSQLKTWLCGICLRKAAEYRRKAYRRRELPSSAEAERADLTRLPEDEMLRRQRAALLYEALASLPDKQREVFVLYEIEELPMLEVARALRCPRFTAYTRLRGARAAVRAFFERRQRRSR